MDDKIRVERKRKFHGGGSASGGGEVVYGLGIVGAAIYFIQHSLSFWGVVIGLMKAIVWPAFVVYELLRSFFG